MVFLQSVVTNGRLLKLKKETKMIGISQLPFPRISDKKGQKYTLLDDLILDQWTIPKGTTVKLYQTNNFGYVMLSKGTVDKSGNIPARNVFNV